MSNNKPAAKTPAQRKADERARHKEAGRVPVTHHVYPEDRAKVARYIKRLNERSLSRRLLDTSKTTG